MSNTILISLESLNELKKKGLKVIIEILLRYIKINNIAFTRIKKDKFIALVEQISMYDKDLVSDSNKILNNIKEVFKKRGLESEYTNIIQYCLAKLFTMIKLNKEDRRKLIYYLDQSKLYEYYILLKERGYENTYFSMRDFSFKKIFEFLPKEEVLQYKIKILELRFAAFKRRLEIFENALNKDLKEHPIYQILEDILKDNIKEQSKLEGKFVGKINFKLSNKEDKKEIQAEFVDFLKSCLIIIEEKYIELEKENEYNKKISIMLK